MTKNEKSSELRGEPKRPRHSLGRAIAGVMSMTERFLSILLIIAFFSGGYFPFPQKAHAAATVIFLTSTGGNDQQTKLLAHFDNNLTDSSASAHTITAFGSAAPSAAQSKFGGYSLLTTSASSQYVRTDAHADFAPGTGSYTIDFWFYGVSGGSPFFARGDSTYAPYLIYGTSFYASSNNTSWDIADAKTIGTVTSGEWVHIAIVRDVSTNTYYIFNNGVQTDTWSNSLTPYNNSSYIQIGRIQAGGTYANGYWDEFRYSNSARWTSNFTPDTNPYGTATWTVPSDWNSSDNTVEVIGGGGGGAHGGGGGGAYSKVSNITLTAGGSVAYSVGAGGSGANPVSSAGAGGDTYFCNSTSNCASIGGSAVQAGAKRGSGGSSGTGGAGGAAASGVGSTKYSGGAGVTSGNWAGPGGGGAAGPNGNGAAGGANDTNNGGGGGGAGGGSAGSAASGSGGTGGNNSSGSGGGAANTAGSNGGGGGGGNQTNATGSGGAGGAGTEWDATHGAGGGGGGGGNTDSTLGFGGNGGLYGGGGGAMEDSNTNGRTGGSGAQGIVVITYTPAPPDAPTNLVTTSITGAVSLSWTAPASTGGSNLETYGIWRATSSFAATTSATLITSFATSTGTTYSDTSAVRGTNYYYRVTATNSTATSTYSNERTSNINVGRIVRLKGIRLR